MENFNEFWANVSNILCEKTYSTFVKLGFSSSKQDLMEISPFMLSSRLKKSIDKIRVWRNILYFVHKLTQVFYILKWFA